MFQEIPVFKTQCQNSTITITMYSIMKHLHLDGKFTKLLNRLKSAVQVNGLPYMSFGVNKKFKCKLWLLNFGISSAYFLPGSVAC